MLETYATDDMKAEIDDEIMRIIQPSNRTLIVYSELLSAKAIHCNPMYDEYLLKGNFIKDLQNFIHQSMRLVWSSNRHATVQDLAQHAISISSLQNASRLGERPPSRDKLRNCGDNRRSK